MFLIFAKLDICRDIPSKIIKSHKRTVWEIHLQRQRNKNTVNFISSQKTSFGISTLTPSKSLGLQACQRLAGKYIFF